ncbi:MAG: polysaccharide pyruvyl transferase family protein [Candidatus Riflebacteria bacterium]|nr:polysaccharide pyruvyl transferase family protein [Candidatus Riflebacteria bacterium]
MKILLCGFFGEGNLGDETILQAIRQQLPDRCSTTITSGKVLSIGGQSIRRRGITAWPAFVQALFENDSALFSGGILQDWSFEGVTFFALRIIAASLLRCEPVLWGAGLGPLRGPGARKLASRALCRVKTAWLRDETSCRLFKELTGNDAGRGADWSWTFPVTARPQRGNAPMAVNLRQWEQGDWRGQVAHQLRHNQRQLVGLAARRSDIDVIKELAPSASVIQPATFSEFADSCRNFSLGLAMRYHAGLAMLRAGLPVKLVAYDDKVSELAESAGVLTIAANQISDFRQASPDFLSSQQQRFVSMQSAFNGWTANIEASRRR